MTEKQANALRREARLITRELPDGEAVVYDLDTSRTLNLEPDTLLLWQQCDGSRSDAQLAELVGRPVEDVQGRLAGLHEAGLLRGDRGTTRRAVLVGGTLAALVPVALVLAPPVAASSSDGVTPTVMTMTGGFNNSYGAGCSQQVSVLAAHFLRNAVLTCTAKDDNGQEVDAQQVGADGNGDASFSFTLTYANNAGPSFTFAVSDGSETITSEPVQAQTCYYE